MTQLDRDREIKEEGPACKGKVWTQCEYCEQKRYVSPEEAEIIRLQRDSDRTDKIG